MKCRQVKLRLVDLLAAECTSSDEIKIRGHLAVCPRCARELEDLEAVDRLLDNLDPEQAPPELLGQVMAAVEKIGPAQARIPRRTSGGPMAARPQAAAVIRDLAAAAAVALVALWAGTGWMSPLASTAGSRVSEAVQSYVHYTGIAVSRAHVSMSSINGNLYGLPKKFSQGSD